MVSSLISGLSKLFHFSSLVSTNQRQLKYKNTTNLLMMKSGKEVEQLIHTVVMSHNNNQYESLKLTG